MTKDEEARARLVEIALRCVNQPKCSNCEGVGECSMCHSTGMYPLTIPAEVRRRAKFRDISSGSWCAAGLTAAMEDAGLVVPAPGTPARRGAVALLDFVRLLPGGYSPPISDAEPGMIIAWLQNKAPEEWRHLSEDHEAHAFRTAESSISMCAKISRHGTFEMQRGMKRCSSCVWETRKGHVAGIVAVDDESITTVGWNEGNTPGRVMKRRLWRHTSRKCPNCEGIDPMTCPITECKGGWIVHPRSSTVLYRRPGGIYGIARPVAR